MKATGFGKFVPFYIISQSVWRGDQGRHGRSWYCRTPFYKSVYTLIALFSFGMS